MDKKERERALEALQRKYSGCMSTEMGFVLSEIDSRDRDISSLNETIKAQTETIGNLLADEKKRLERVKDLEEGIRTFVDWVEGRESFNYIKDIPDEIYIPFYKLLPNAEQSLLPEMKT